jgi:hypothetical protein
MNFFAWCPRGWKPLTATTTVALMQASPNVPDQMACTSKTIRFLCRGDVPVADDTPTDEPGAYAAYHTTTEAGYRQVRLARILLHTLEELVYTGSAAGDAVEVEECREGVVVRAATFAVEPLITDDGQPTTAYRFTRV